jgi:hypothetical protein
MPLGQRVAHMPPERRRSVPAPAQAPTRRRRSAARAEGLAVCTRKGSGARTLGGGDLAPLKLRRDDRSASCSRRTRQAPQHLYSRSARMRGLPYTRRQPVKNPLRGRRRSAARADSVRSLFGRLSRPECWHVWLTARKDGRGLWPARRVRRISRLVTRSRRPTCLDERSGRRGATGAPPTD